MSIYPLANLPTVEELAVERAKEIRQGLTVHGGQIGLDGPALRRPACDICDTYHPGRCLPPVVREDADGTPIP